MAIRELTPEERSQLTLKRGKMSPVGQRIKDMKPATSIEIPFADYPYKRGPKYIIYRLNGKSKKYVWSRIMNPDRKGFVVDRLP